jgi:hypothetical protein
VLKRPFHAIVGELDPQALSGSPSATSSRRQRATQGDSTLSNEPCNQYPEIWNAVDLYNIPIDGHMNVQRNDASRLEWRIVDADGYETRARESNRPLRDEAVINPDVDEELSCRRTLVDRRSSEGREEDRRPDRELDMTEGRRLVKRRDIPGDMHRMREICR